MLKCINDNNSRDAFSVARSYAMFMFKTVVYICTCRELVIVYKGEEILVS